DNAARAGVSSDVEICERSLAMLDAPSGPGTLATNPPYGVRIGARSEQRRLYAELGRMARARCPGWTMALLCPAGPDAALSLPLSVRLSTRNGGIAVRLIVGRIP